MTFRKLIGRVHLWLGLSSGLLVFIVATTGCILAFEREIKSFTQPYRYVEPVADGRFLPPSVLKAKAERALPGKKANGILYHEKNNSVEVGFYNAVPEYYYIVFVNAYSGQVLKVWNEDEDFFHFILHGHYYLWLPEKVGQPVVAYGTLLFVVMLISGLILWWPKNQSAARQRFSIKWRAKWRRVNYDLHNVPGFYVLVIGLVLGLTGMVFGIEWFSRSVYWATSGGKILLEYQQPLSDTTLTRTDFALTSSVDRVWVKLSRENPGEPGIYLAIPGKDSESIFAYVNHRAGSYYKMDYYNFDQYTLQPLSDTGPYSGKYANASFADKLRRMNYDIHVGAILGLPGKILAFCASLICASLPVTGFIIWWGRRNKKKDSKPRATPKAVSGQSTRPISAEKEKVNYFQSKP